MNDRSDLLVPRPHRAPQGDAAGTAGKASALVVRCLSLFCCCAAALCASACSYTSHTLTPSPQVGPATAASMPGGAWPVELLDLFMSRATLPKAEAAARPGELSCVARAAGHAALLERGSRCAALGSQTVSYPLPVRHPCPCAAKGKKGGRDAAVEVADVLEEQVGSAGSVAGVPCPLDLLLPAVPSAA